MRRLLVSLALMTALIGGCVWSDRTLDKTLGAVRDEVEAERYGEAETLWNEAKPLLGSLLPHQEIEQSERLFSRVRRAEAIGAGNELAIERAELLGQLSHLPELDAVSIQNIF